MCAGEIDNLSSLCNSQFLFVITVENCSMNVGYLGQKLFNGCMFNVVPAQIIG